MTRALFGVFGYGSLVNLDTLKDAPLATASARVFGWERRWLRRPPGSVQGPAPGQRKTNANPPDFAFLSAQPTDRARWIDGRILIYPLEHMAALDRREALYDRVELQPDSVRWLDDAPLEHRAESLVIYAARKAVMAQTQLILRSYLDAVLQGYLRTFGQAGLTHFAQTTTPRTMTIFEDRNQPLYPRAIALSKAERHAIDALWPPSAPA
ncbi:MAG: gamma-glutamylcyclotransferase family protein [Pseudomonadota bacterium]